MFLTANNEVMGVARCQTMPHTHRCCIASPVVNELTRIFVEQDDERLRVISSEAGNQDIIKTQSISKTIAWANVHSDSWHSKRIHNYCVHLYRRLGNNVKYGIAVN